MEPSWDPGALLAAGGTRDTGKRLVMPNINKAVRFPAINSCNPRFPFWSLIQSQWHPDRRLPEFMRHTDAKVGKV